MKKHNQNAKDNSKKIVEKAENAVEAVKETAEETVDEVVEKAEDAAEELVDEVTEETTQEPAEESSEEQKESSDNNEDSEPEENESEESEGSEEKEEPQEEETDSESEASEKDEKSQESEESEESDEEEEEDEEKAVAASKKKKRRSRKHSEDEELDEEEEAKEKSSLYMFFDTVRFVAVGLLVGILLVVFVIQRNDVYGSSMEPTLQSGDAVFVQMLSVYTGNFKRGDIVTIDAKGMEGYTHEENLIKRVIGLPGETIKIEDGDVYINGNLLDESEYLPAETRTYVGAEGQARGYMEMTLGPNEYYCMGDNRATSRDSRRLGPFTKDRLESKVLMRIYPFSKIKFF